MKKLFAVLAVLAVTVACGKPKPKIHVTSPLTYEETKAILTVMDDALAEQKIFNEKIAAYNKIRSQVNKLHKLDERGDFRSDDVNCPLIGDGPCEKTVLTMTPEEIQKMFQAQQQQTLPPVQVDPKTETKETPKK